VLCSELPPLELLSLKQQFPELPPLELLPLEAQSSEAVAEASAVHLLCMS
jgi:hypothetical protein